MLKLMKIIQLTNKQTMKYIKLFEEFINEIGDGSSGSYRYSGPNFRKVKSELDKLREGSNGMDWSKTKVFHWTFKSKNATYKAKINVEVKKRIIIDILNRNQDKREGTLRASIGFYVTSGQGDVERTTNFGEQFKVMATIADIFIDFVNNIIEEYYIEKFYMIPKADNGEELTADNRRGKLYKSYMEKQIKRIKMPVSISTIDVETNSGKDAEGFVLRDGHQSSGRGTRIKN